MENTSNHIVVDLSSWTIKHNEIIYKIPENIKLNPSCKLKVWSQDYAHFARPRDLINKNIKNWGFDTNNITTVLDRFGKEKTKFSQQTIRVELEK